MTVETTARQAKTHYSVLGVTENASDQEINRAYKVRAMKCHPDRVAPEMKEEAEARFKEINAAKRILMDPVARGSYDQSLKLQRAESRHRSQKAHRRPGSSEYRTQTQQQPRQPQRPRQPQQPSRSATYSSRPRRRYRAYTAFFDDGFSRQPSARASSTFDMMQRMTPPSQRSSMFAQGPQGAAPVQWVIIQYGPDQMALVVIANGRPTQVFQVISMNAQPNIVNHTGFDRPQAAPAARPTPQSQACAM